VTVSNKQIERVVVRGTNWVGDAVMTIPALRLLRRILPAAHITLATRSFARAIFDDAAFVDQVISVEGNLIGQVKEWKSHRFDLAILLQNAFAPALISRLAGVPIRIGYATQGRSRLLTHPLPLPEWRNQQHESFYYLNVVAAIAQMVGGLAGEPANVLELQPEFDLPVDDQRKAEAAELLNSMGVKSGSQVVALCPGSINSRAKRWPAERYAFLADRLIEEAGAAIILIGSAAESDIAEEVRGRMKHEPIVMTGKTDLTMAVAILSQVDLLVTNDTGPAHIAAAMNRPTLVIFGPTNPLTTRPLSQYAEIVREPPDCAPCMLRDCPIDHRCMTAISPGQIFERAVTILNANSDRRQVVARHSAESFTDAKSVSDIPEKLRSVEHLR
jgi:heptosyltransferase-2